jgi:hypothetical protein
VPFSFSFPPGGREYEGLIDRAMTDFANSEGRDVGPFRVSAKRDECVVVFFREFVRTKTHRCRCSAQYLPWFVSVRTVRIVSIAHRGGAPHSPFPQVDELYDVIKTKVDANDQRFKRFMGKPRSEEGPFFLCDD